jgi:hypothetical protein
MFASNIGVSQMRQGGTPRSHAITGAEHALGGAKTRIGRLVRDHRRGPEIECRKQCSRPLRGEIRRPPGWMGQDIGRRRAPGRDKSAKIRLERQHPCAGDSWGKTVCQQQARAGQRIQRGQHDTMETLGTECTADASNTQRAVRAEVRRGKQLLIQHTGPV